MFPSAHHILISMLSPSVVNVYTIASQPTAASQAVSQITQLELALNYALQILTITQII